MEEPQNPGLAEATASTTQCPAISPNAFTLPSGLAITVVLALTFAVYSPTLRYQFVHDDRGQIVENPAVHSWRFVPTYFTSHVWSAVMPAQLGNYYRPLFLLWLRINDAVFGNHAWGWHLTTILAHLLATFLVYLLALQLGISTMPAVLAALIFGLHPAHIEAVDWISGVTEPLLCVLLLGSLLSYIRWRRRSASRWKLLSLALFACALGEKETALIFPGLLLAYDWLFPAPAEIPHRNTVAEPAASNAGRNLGAWCVAALRRIWSFFLLIALYIPARVYALKGFSHAVTPLRFAQLAFTWPSLIWFWIRHLIWPGGLTTFYDFPAVTHPTLTNFALPCIFDVLAAAALLASVRKSRVASFAALWLVLPLLPLLDLRVFVADDFAHDRYLYLPSLGFAILIAMALTWISHRVGDGGWKGRASAPPLERLRLGSSFAHRTVRRPTDCAVREIVNDCRRRETAGLKPRPSSPGEKSGLKWLLAEPTLPVAPLDLRETPASLLIAAFCLAALSSYGILTQSFYFRDNLTFYAYNSLAAPHNTIAEADYASILAEQGLYGPALEKFKDVLRRDPNCWAAVYNLGLTYYKLGNLPEAEKYFLEAVRLSPYKADEHFYLGMTWFKSARTDQAIASVRRALAINPSGFAYHFALGVMLKSRGDLTDALQEFKTELAVNPQERAAARQIEEIEQHLPKAGP